MPILPSITMSGANASPSTVIPRQAALDHARTCDRPGSAGGENPQRAPIVRLRYFAAKSRRYGSRSAMKLDDGSPIPEASTITSDGAPE
jgi:hypothetical protein